MSFRVTARTLLFAAATLLVISARTSVVLAQPSAKSNENADNGHAIPVPSVQAVRRTSPIIIDGKLDDAAWSAAQVVTQFTQYDPNTGKAPTQKTAVRILFDENALYIGATMFDTAGPNGITTRLVRRDNQFDSDYFQIVLDGYHDHLSRAFFTVNPSGSKQDQIGLGASCCDSGWDPVWEVQTRINADSWTAEIRIPLNQLRYSGDSLQTWGMQLRRYIQRNHEEDDWSFWDKTEAGGAPRFGHLKGLEISHSSRHLELLPYVSSTARALQADKHDPFNYGVHPSARVGADIKYLLTSNLTLDATINPDFGQVEVDPAVVNLSAFETSFDEKRPFFIEGSGVFDFGSFNCFFCSNVSPLNAFYSRRIGRAPTGAGLAYSAGKYADVPDASVILGAAKITGRTSNGYTVGLLNAVTNRESARVEFADGSKGSQEVEPLSNYFVGRVKKDFLRGNLVIGGIGTSVKRNLDATFTPRLASHAEFVGADIRYNFGNHNYTLIANSGLSTVSGDSNVILARQMNSAHYFQRPDRGAGSDGFFSNRLDSSATSLIGAGGYARLAKDAGNWLWETAVNVRTPGFENNDLAFNQRSDYIFYNANIFRNWQTPTRLYRKLNLIFGGQQQKNFEGDLTDRQLQLYAGTTTPQFWDINSFYIWHPALLDDRLLRGGPVVQRPGTGYQELDMSTDSRKAVVLRSTTNYSWNTRGGWGASISENINYRPSSNVSISFGPSWSDAQSLLQYLTAIPDAQATNFFGTRYIMSGLRQKVLALDTRVNMTFSPRMTLELYAQPFFASGHYAKFKQFNAPRQGQFSIFGQDVGTIATVLDTLGKISQYTIDPDGVGPASAFSFANPDFTQRSLRGNAVFRWEYRPGSVVYLAWTHSRFNQDGEGNLDFSRERTALEASHPNNVFLVKISWWIPR
ncbi:MAG: DUF5916 domain-containing protein [Gemmatimonadaceae bacterium]